jgi:hypothetical protein
VLGITALVVVGWSLWHLQLLTPQSRYGFYITLIHQQSLFVPIAITVVNAEQLEQQQIYSIEDLARTTPALEMIQAFGGPGGGGQVRGISTVTFSQTAEAAVGIVVDGVPQGNVNTNDIFDVERVEVLRGPQGTLFGLTTSAGVINMTTQAPKIGEFEEPALGLFERWHCRLRVRAQHPARREHTDQRGPGAAHQRLGRPYQGRAVQYAARRRQ